MHAHACGLVDDCDALVFVNHIKRNIFCKGLQRRQFNRASDDDLFSTAQPHGWLGRLSIELDLFLLDKLLNPHATDLGELRDKPLVKASASGVDRDREDPCWECFGHAGIVVDQQVMLEVEAVKKPGSLSVAAITAASF